MIEREVQEELIFIEFDHNVPCPFRFFRVVVYVSEV